MRFFFQLCLALAILTVLVVGTAGFRGGMSRKPPIEVFPDMDRQPKIRPQTPSSFFADGKASRPPVLGSVARGSQYLVEPLTTGLVNGSTNFVEVSPMPVTAELMRRGRERYQISCLPCHGPLADGNGITRKFGMAVVANLHDKRIVSMPDGEIFSVITNGRNLMGPYGANVAVEDRWAIVAYLRALQFSRLGYPGDVPAEMNGLVK